MTLNDYIAKYKHEPYDLYVRVKTMLESTSSIKVKETLIRSFDCISVHIFCYAIINIYQRHGPCLDIKSKIQRVIQCICFCLATIPANQYSILQYGAHNIKAMPPTGIVSAFKKSKFIDLAPTFVGITTPEELEIKLDLLGY